MFSHAKKPNYYIYTVENIEGTITNGHSTDIGNDRRKTQSYDKQNKDTT